MEFNYQYYLAVTKELEPYELEDKLPSLSVIETTMPKTFSLLKRKAKQFEVVWENFREDLNQVIKALREIKKEAGNNIYLAELAGAQPWIRPAAFVGDPAAHAWPS